MIKFEKVKQLVLEAVNNVGFEREEIQEIEDSSTLIELLTCFCPLGFDQADAAEFVLGAIVQENGHEDRSVCEESAAGVDESHETGATAIGGEC